VNVHCPGHAATQTDQSAIGARISHATGFRESVVRANGSQDRYELGFGPLEGAVTCRTALTEPDFFPQWLASVEAYLLSKYDQAPQQTVAAYLMWWYLTIPGIPATALFHAERRVPMLSPDDLAFTRQPLDGPTPGWVTQVSLLSPAFACLPDDPAAGLPGTTVVADDARLAALLRARHVAHVAQFIPVLKKHVRLGAHQLWSAATDVLDQGLLTAGRVGGDPSGGALDAALVLPAAFKPLTSASRIRSETVDGRQEWLRDRQSCCFHYVLKNGDGPCAGCPRA
jgi:hypothetical protein